MAAQVLVALTAAAVAAAGAPAGERRLLTKVTSAAGRGEHRSGVVPKSIEREKSQRWAVSAANLAERRRLSEGPAPSSAPPAQPPQLAADPLPPALPIASPPHPPPPSPPPTRRPPPPSSPPRPPPFPRPEPPPPPPPPPEGCPIPRPPPPPNFPSSCPEYPATAVPPSRSDTTESLPYLSLQKDAQNQYIEALPGAVYTLTSGCPVAIELAPIESLYLKIWVGPGEVLKYSWTTSQPFVLFYDWHLIPYYHEHDGGGDNWNAYNYYSSTISEFEFSPNFATRNDFYHMATGPYEYCGAASRLPANSECSVGLDPEVNSGWVYLTIHSLVSDYVDVNAPMHGELVFEVVPPTLTFIQPPQLGALLDLFLGCCKPTQDALPIWDLFSPAGSVNRHWTRRNHMRGAYSAAAPDTAFLFWASFNTTGDERNPDEIPYCDWLFTSRLDSAGGKVLALPIGLSGAGNCELLDYVTCDPDGNVVELDLSGLGLTGSLPSSMSELTGLKRLYLNDNKLEGPAPDSIVFGSASLRQVQLAHNFFTGPLPCPPQPEAQLELLSVSQNSFSGHRQLPCLFSRAPRLRSLYLDYLKLDGEIPSEIKEAAQLRELHADHAGLRGQLPAGMRCLTQLESLSLGRNALDGTVPQPVVDGMTNLRELTLSFNGFSGAIPSIPASHTKFRHLLLDHNAFSGDFATQLSSFAANLLAGGDAYSTISLDHNDLSGSIPPVVYGMIHDARGMGAGYAPTSWHLSMVENHLLCAPGPGREWPLWVLRAGSDFFGKCTPVAKPRRLTAPAGQDGGREALQQRVGGGPAWPPVLVGGQEPTLLTVEGEDFEPSAELRCRLTPAPSSGLSTLTVGALFESQSSVKCPLPAETPPGNYTLSVANYGEDFYSAQTAGPEFYTPVPLVVSRDRAEAEFGVLTTGEILGAVVGALAGLVLIVCLLCALCVLIAREKRGAPLFYEMPADGGRVRRPGLPHDDSGLSVHELQMQVSIDPNAR